MTIAFFSENLGIDLIDHYEKPEKYVEGSLRILSFQHKEILYDRVKEGIVINFGEGFESSLFGSKPILKSHTDPWLGEPVIRTEEDLENLNYPDFYEISLLSKFSDYTKPLRECEKKDSRARAIRPRPNTNPSLEKIKTWINIARKTIESHACDPSGKVAK